MKEYTMQDDVEKTSGTTEQNNNNWFLFKTSSNDLQQISAILPPPMGIHQCHELQKQLIVNVFAKSILLDTKLLFFRQASHVR